MTEKLLSSLNQKQLADLRVRLKAIAGYSDATDSIDQLLTFAIVEAYRSVGVIPPTFAQIAAIRSAIILLEIRRIKATKVRLAV